MPELDDIIQRISLSGQDDVISAFGEIGKAGAKAFADLAKEGGEIGTYIGAAVTAITGLVVGMGALAKHSTEAVIELRNLANQTGESISGISQLQAGLSAMGADTEHLGMAFRRMGLAIEGSWTSIKKESGEARDKQISDFLAVQKAQQSAFDAREKAREKLDELGVPTSNLGYVSDYQKRQNEIAKVRTSLAEADLKVRETQRKADEDRLNSLEAITTAVEKIVKGEAAVADVGKEANLSTENIIKGITAISTPGATDVIKNLTGDFQQLTGLSPDIKQAFYNVADFLHNAKDAATEAALEFRFFGRGIGQDMIVPLKEGSAAIKEAEERMKGFGLVITDDALKPAEEFHKQFNELSYALKTTITQEGLKFDPAFTAGMKNLSDFVEQNHEAFMKLGDDLAAVVGPIVKAFAEGIVQVTAALAGMTAALANIKVDPDTVIGKWTKAWQIALHALNPLVSGIQELISAYRLLAQVSQAVGDKDWAKVADLLKHGPKEETAATGEEKEKAEGGIGSAGLREAGTHTAAVNSNTTALGRLTSAIDKQTGAHAGATSAQVKAANNIADRLKPGMTLESERPGGPKFVTPPKEKEVGAPPVPPGFVTPPKVKGEPEPQPKLQPPPEPQPTPLGAQPPGMVIRPSYPETAVQRLGTAAEQPVITIKSPEWAKTPPPPPSPPKPQEPEAAVPGKITYPFPTTNPITEGLKTALAPSVPESFAFSGMAKGLGGGKQSDQFDTAVQGFTTKLTEGAGAVSRFIEALTPKNMPTNIPGSTGEVGVAGEQAGEAGTAIKAISDAAQRLVTRPQEGAGALGPASEQTTAGEQTAATTAAIKATGDAAQGMVSKLNDAASALGNFVSSLQTASSSASGGGGGGGAPEAPAPVATAGTEGFATGGLVGGSEGHDTNIIRATKGEYVVRKDGGNLGEAIAHFTKGFAEGGLVGGFVESMRIPGYATGGVVVHTASVGAGGSSGRPIELHIGGEKVSGLTANESAANQISRIAVERAVRSGYSGGKSSWYRGS